ncbi:NAD-dependent epimerase/dehydratase family protein [Blastopirellula sp. J2-11]|uniref:NAD-dependent epimerase/dehydratase family protein n=1 Tax=Blastopirellula sp. J2-11 TaxID=2943192 RepID=UPI0021C63305|nr:NAD-dependent epimerase/dehydratase family protein [Blastopirellula sp. J2-11]UUO07183.1 NAD-dependent epimerase/dehydratase family protein [Blastopirellula sp. J2-11]
MKLLITGVCGFVGSVLAKAWLETSAFEIIGLDNLSRLGSELNRNDLRKRGVRLIHGDIRCSSDLQDLPEVNYVIDASANPTVLAGIDGRSNSRQLVEHNLLGTINLLEYCRRVQAGFILLSTSRVYSIDPLKTLDLVVDDGACRPVLDENAPPGLSAEGVSEDFSTTPPLSLYGATKLTSETLALEYGSAYEFPVWINRCDVMAGAGQFGRAEQGIFSYWIHSWQARKPLRYLGYEGTGIQVRSALSPLDVSPVLEQQMAFSDTPEHRVFNLSGGIENSISLNNLSRWCEQKLGPHQVLADRTPRKFDIPWIVLDSARAKRVWNFQPRISLDTLLNQITDFAQSHPDWLDLVAD